MNRQPLGDLLPKSSKNLKNIAKLLIEPVDVVIIKAAEDR
jgi:hypothetical protein